MTDVFAKFNETNWKRQGDQINLIKTKAVLSAFVAYNFLWKQNLGRGECSQFQNLSKLQNRDEDLLAYCQHLTALLADLNKNIEDILHMDIPDWVLNPFVGEQTQIPDIDDSILIQDYLLNYPQMSNLNRCLKNDTTNSGYKKRSQFYILHYWLLCRSCWLLSRLPIW